MNDDTVILEVSDTELEEFLAIGNSLERGDTTSIQGLLSDSLDPLLEKVSAQEACPVPSLLEKILTAPVEGTIRQQRKRNAEHPGKVYRQESYLNPIPVVQSRSADNRTHSSATASEFPFSDHPPLDPFPPPTSHHTPSSDLSNYLEQLEVTGISSEEEFSCEAEEPQELYFQAVSVTEKKSRKSKTPPTDPAQGTSGGPSPKPLKLKGVPRKIVQFIRRVEAAFPATPSVPAGGSYRTLVEDLPTIPLKQLVGKHPIPPGQEHLDVVAVPLSTVCPPTRREINLVKRFRKKRSPSDWRRLENRRQAREGSCLSGIPPLLPELKPRPSTSSTRAPPPLAPSPVQGIPVVVTATPKQSTSFIAKHRRRIVRRL